MKGVLQWAEEERWVMVYTDGILIFQELLETADLWVPFSSPPQARMVLLFSLGLSLYLFTEELEVEA